MTIILYQESWDGRKDHVRYFVILKSAHHHYCRKVSKESWLTILDHLWNNPLFAHTKFDVNYYNGGRVAIWTDEFKEC